MQKVGKVATFAGISGVFAPLVLGLLAALPFGYPVEQALFFGVVLAATSVSIIHGVWIPKNSLCCQPAVQR